jgi:hypothetical protein
MIIPSVGRVVHFVQPKGKHLPAIITHVHGNTVTEDSLVNLQVFTDSKKEPLQHEAKVKQAQANKQPGTWHEPERV